MSAYQCSPRLRVSETTAAFGSWLAATSQMWGERQRGEKVALPGWVLFHLFAFAAVAVAVSYVLDVMVLAVAGRVSVIRDDRRAARMARQARLGLGNLPQLR